MMKPPAEDELPLAAEFAPATREQWLALVEGVLKGARFEDRLVSRTRDGLRIEPLYARSPGAQPIAAHTEAGRAWQVLQRVDHPDAVEANTQALRDLETGATGLALICAGAVGARGYGLEPSRATFERALEGVHLDAGIALELDCGPRVDDAADAIAAVVERHGAAPAALAIRFGFDPLGAMAVRGGAPLPWPDTAPAFAAAVAKLAARGFRGPFAVGDGRPVHAAGGSEAQELAWALASAVAYLRALAAHGIALDAARRMLSFRLAADADQFLTIAKFRALRLLWARVEAACGLDGVPVFVTAETAWRMLTRRDPHVNILRGTIAALAAGVGGADAISVLPFTAALGLPDRFARRVARNTQLVLIEESGLAKVADPAAGAGAFEDLTEKLARAAWARFQEIEAHGGADAALASGLIQSKVAAVRAERERAVAHRREAITGTSEFPQLEEAPVTVLDVPPARIRAESGMAFAPLPAVRLAEPFERLRDASDRVLAATGTRPNLFLANLGKPSDFTPRATFAKNLFEAGGIATIGNDGFAERHAMIAAFKSSGARLACLCASDEVYAAEASAAAAALKAGGAAHIYVAGRPGSLSEQDRRTITAFVHVGCDALAILTAAHQTLGIDTGA